MRRLSAVLLLAFAASPAAAQQAEVTAGSGAVLRAVDKVDGEITNFELRRGASQRIGRLTVTLQSCRYPSENPAGEAYAYLVIDDAAQVRHFDGWMVASSPALNALEHPRYDVWVLRCKTE